MKSVKILIALFLAGSATQAFGQKKFKGKPIEFGITLGAANYMGDLSKLVAINPPYGRPNL